jgi:hypothetical protein
MNWKAITVFMLATVLGFLLMGNAPLGNLLWPPAEGPDPEGANLALLMVIGGIEAIAFGLGITFLFFGLPYVQNLTMTRGAYATAIWLSITWMLANWVPHTSLHMNVGNILVPADFGGLVAIEYGFHLTLIIAGGLLAHAAVRSSRLVAPVARPASTTNATKRMT